MIDKHLGDSARLKVHDLLRGAFQYAVLPKQLAADPMFGIKRPAYEAPAVLSLTREQIESLLVEIVNDPLCAFCAVAIASGMREGELFSLTWSSVDLDFGVRVNVALQDAGVVGSGPAKAFYRRRENANLEATDPTHSLHASDVARTSRALEAHCPSDLVFPNALGRPMWRQNVLRRSFRPLAQASGSRR